MLPNGLWESQLVHCSLLKHPYGRPWICFFGMEVTSRGPFLRDALIMSRSPSYNVAVSGRSKTLLRCGTRSLQRFGRFGISAGGYSPQTKGVIEFGGWSRESQALFFCFSYISKKKRCFKELHHFCRKVDNAFQDFTHSIFGCTLQQPSFCSYVLPHRMQQQLLPAYYASKLWRCPFPPARWECIKTRLTTVKYGWNAFKYFQQNDLGKTNMEPDTVLLVPEPSIFYLLWLQGGGPFIAPASKVPNSQRGTKHTSFQ